VRHTKEEIIRQSIAALNLYYSDLWAGQSHLDLSGQPRYKRRRNQWQPVDTHFRRILYQKIEKDNTTIPRWLLDYYQMTAEYDLLFAVPILIPSYQQFMKLVQIGRYAVTHPENLSSSPDSFEALYKVCIST
jgi:hypothetical protein